MTDIKQVKVDNWGVYFLQRLKHFFNRTDYCDLTLQFQDNAQLKVHRLVLNACTEYFELLERTCEMYEDCLVMPDDLQADVVVPIINFMYTGQLEFKPELLEKLYQTSQVMNMPVLTKLLQAHRNQSLRPALTHDYRNIKSYSKTFDASNASRSSTAIASTSYMPTKRSYTKAFENNAVIQKNKKQSVEKTSNKVENISNNLNQQRSSSYVDSVDFPVVNNKKQTFKECRPTRYELPEELDGDNVFDNSFTPISYTSTPLMVHPETVKRYSSKKRGIFDDTSNAKRFLQGTSTLDILECKKITINDNIFEDDPSENFSEDSFPSTISINPRDEPKDASQLFDQIIDNDNQKFLESKEAERSKPKLDHAKIISEVLKKYPHLVKSNKNIKLKILNTSGKSKKPKTPTNVFNEEKEVKPKVEQPDFTYETDVIDSKEAAKLIAMGAENIKGPWICLICGTPGRAIHFTSYYKFRRHLVDVHNEKPIPTICEYCGMKSMKRNYILHHLYTKHGVEPPPHYHFPKCNYCNYIALTEGYLVKHKLTHIENRNFGCNVCPASFNTSNQLLAHIQKTGHKYSAEKKNNLQCIYCLKTFSRETNLYTHLKTIHKQSAQTDGIIDESDEEKQEKRLTEFSETEKNIAVKYEDSVSFDNEYENLDVQFQIHQKPDGNIQVLPKSPQALSAKHKILNPGFNSTKTIQKAKVSINNKNKQEPQDASMPSINNENDGIVLIDGSEYIVKGNQLIARTQNISNDDYILPNCIPEQSNDNSLPTTSMEFPNIHHTNNDEPKMIIKKTSMNQPIQIVVSNEDEYKALMSSNHSIIFEEAETNKTLTVLTAPQNTNLEGTTIDLDSSQSNNMMIIQDDYPLNVTESVSADNSNIVVVYSHPLDDQNKQFQYITSQGIEAQFIQSSAMITHNYETITTSTPVMSAHVIDTQMAESWQNSIKQKLQVETQLQPKTEVCNNQIVQIKAVSKTNSLTTTLDDNNTVKVTIADNTIPVVTNDIIANAMNQVIVQEVDNIPSINTSVSVHNDQLVHKEIQTENINDNYSNEVDILKCKMSDINKHLQLREPSNENLIVVEQAVEVINTGDNTNLPNALNNSGEIKENSTQDVPNETCNIEVPMSHIEVTVTKVANEQIQSLTSEWSEDENEREATSEKIDINTSKTSPNIISIDTEASVYTEESIENIQQEMAKQMEAIVTESNTLAQVLEPPAVISVIQPITKCESTEKETSLESTMESNVIVETINVSKETNVEPDHTNNVVEVNIPLLTSTDAESVTTNAEIVKITSDSVEPITTPAHPECTISEANLTIQANPENFIVSDEIETTTEIKELATLKAEAEIEDNDTNTSQNDRSMQPQLHTVTTLTKTAHDKISSLLNDWEDNDSQEDNSSKIENEVEIPMQKGKIVEDIVSEKDLVLEKSNELSSNDNIKKLVSDWDDDEEESK